jgi:hypothetical protein
MSNYLGPHTIHQKKKFKLNCAACGGSTKFLLSLVVDIGSRWGDGTTVWDQILHQICGHNVVPNQHRHEVLNPRKLIIH